MEKNGFKVFFSRTTVGQFQPNLTGIEFVCMTWCVTCGTNDVPRYKHSLLKTIFLFNYNNDCTLLLTITYNAGNACPLFFTLNLTFNISFNASKSEGHEDGDFLCVLLYFFGITLNNTYSCLLTFKCVLETFLANVGTNYKNY